MKRITILYWSITILFGGFMLFSAIPDLLMVEDAIVFITGLGYPAYIIPFLGLAKILGVIAIFIPGFPRVMEWAYAGLFFDLLGATYSSVAVAGFDPSHFFMLLPFSFLFASYFLAHRRRKLPATGN